MDQMSVIEHLRFYARVRGVEDVERNVTAVITAVGLVAFSDRMAAKLSGKSLKMIQGSRFCLEALSYAVDTCYSSRDSSLDSHSAFPNKFQSY